ncbi:hypothetical protein HPB47_018315, partial [Ixodes persulcatus]
PDLVLREITAAPPRHDVSRRPEIGARRVAAGEGSQISTNGNEIICLPSEQLRFDVTLGVGRLRATCMDDPLYDLVLGNIDGARTADDPDPNWSFETARVAPPLGDRETSERRDSGEGATAVSKEQSCCSAPESGMSANPVVTRAQSREQAPFRKLSVKNEFPEMGREELMREQAKDPQASHNAPARLPYAMRMFSRNSNTKRRDERQREISVARC